MVEWVRTQWTLTPPKLVSCGHSLAFSVPSAAEMRHVLLDFSVDMGWISLDTRNASNPDA